MLPTKVNQLAGPVISGQVSVPLAELDKMRSDHANALALAAKLEEQQKGIVITLKQAVMETRCVNDYLYPVDYGSTGRVGNVTPKEVKRFESFQSMQDVEVSYKNMDEVLGRLKSEATAAVQKEIDTAFAARDKSEQAAVRAKKELSDAKKTHTKKVGKLELELQEQIDENLGLVEQVAAAVKDFNKSEKLYVKAEIANENLRLIVDDYEETIDRLEDRLMKKSLLNRIFG